MYLKRDSLGRAEIMGDGELRAPSPSIPVLTGDVAARVREAVTNNIPGARVDAIVSAATYGAVQTYTAGTTMPDGSKRMLYVAVRPPSEKRTPQGTVKISAGVMVSTEPFKPSMFGSTSSGGISWGDILDKAKQILPQAVKVAENPAAKVMFPYLSFGTLAANEILKQQQKGSAPAPAPAPKPAAPPQAVAARPMAPAAPAAPSVAGIGYPSTIMGADPPMSDSEIMQLIRREPNRLKRARMVENFQRSRQRRDW